MQLNDEQAEALGSILHWYRNSDQPFFVLSGSAGTGKTFTCRALLHALDRDVKVCFTAPTNKAVKVLTLTLAEDAPGADFATTYSLLGLRLTADGAVKRISAKGSGKRATGFNLIIVDEGSMVNEALMYYIKKVANRFTKFLFMGDPAQLPPVGEAVSPVWQLGALDAHLTKVMRHDNQILTLCTRLRDAVAMERPTIKIQPDFDKTGGVHTMEPVDFCRAIARHAAFRDGFQNGTSKVIAWRNATVHGHNQRIRDQIWGANSNRFVQGERVVFGAPIFDGDIPLAHTDDEGIILDLQFGQHPEYTDFGTLDLTIAVNDDDTHTVVAHVLRNEELQRFNALLEELSAAAKRNPYKWQQFWHFKDAFADVRYAYAITAHRAQGSTYTTSFTDCRDILANRNRVEAYKCLYVACSRPTTNLILG